MIVMLIPHITHIVLMSLYAFIDYYYHHMGMFLFNTFLVLKEPSVEVNLHIHGKSTIVTVIILAKVLGCLHWSYLISKKEI